MYQAYALNDAGAIVSGYSPACASAYTGTDAWKCIFGSYALPYVQVRRSAVPSLIVLASVWGRWQPTHSLMHSTMGAMAANAHFYPSIVDRRQTSRWFLNMYLYDSFQLGSMMGVQVCLTAAHG